MVRGTFSELDDLIEASDVVNKDEFVPGLFESMTWQGVTYGVPAFENVPRYGLSITWILLTRLDLIQTAHHRLGMRCLIGT